MRVCALAMRFKARALETNCATPDVLLANDFAVLGSD